MRDLRYSSDVRRRLFVGVEKLSKAVAVTLGPKGRNVLIERGFGSPLMTKDGVTVAKEVKLSDKFENLGAQTIKEAATRTNETAGDGTTTATVLAHGIISEGLKLVEAGHDPMEIRRGIEAAMADAIANITKNSRPVQDREDLLHIATISANNDAVIGGHIADAFTSIGKDGVVTVEESRGFETYVEYLEGMQFDKGYLSPYFANTDNFTVEYDKPYILLADEPIVSAQMLAGLLEGVRRQQRALVIIARDVSGDALTALVVNNSRGIIQAAAVRAPSFGDRQRLMLEDLAILVGGEIISQHTGLELKDVKIEHLGSCDRIKITSQETIIINGHGKKEAIDERIALLRANIEEERSSFLKEQHQERLSKLSGGVAVLHVGGATEVELLERKHRVEDALSATRAAIETGTVPGGGVALLRIAEDLEAVDFNGLSVSYAVGYSAVRLAMRTPLRQIATNAGVSADVIIDKLQQKDEFEYGWDAKNNVFGNMYELGIIDPAKVTVSAMRNACSVAGMFLTTECAIVDMSNITVTSNNDLPLSEM
jgi:chaperonin GroEL